jgi:hypothetical protein
MKTEQLEKLNEIFQGELKQSERWLEYWKDFSEPSTWQFWVVLAMFLFPLICVILFIDRKKMLHVGFYGYSVHVFFTYSDLIGTHNAYWIYPYKLSPYFPSSLTLDASFVPVAYMLLYQYTLDKKKNYYIWFGGMCLTFAYIFKPLLLGLGLFHFRGKENFFLLFLGYLLVALIAKWITDFFLLLMKSNKFSLYEGKKEV